MATTTDDKGEFKLLPVDCLFAIYDINTHILYLAARGTYDTPTLTRFARQVWFNSIKFAFESFYNNFDNKLIINKFAKEFLINLLNKITDAIIIIVDNTKSVKILRVPLLLS